VIHVSGTNGKFSVLAIATAILTELGLIVGTYTSPDLGVVRERIGFALEPIDEEGFAAVLTYLLPYIELTEESLGDQLTYFELLTVMAFEAFFDRPAHAAVIETGLGGEYDATNVADARVAVVTNVTLDHIRQFGGDLAKAAWEKAGIAKQDSIVISGIDQDDVFDIVAKRAFEKGATSVHRAGVDLEIVDRRVAVGGQVISVRGLHGTYDGVFLALFGEHQAHNALLAIAACEAFVGEALETTALERALATVQTPGRIEVVARRPLIVCDGGHNPASAEVVKAAIAEAFTYERLTMVVGMLSEKLIDEVLSIWAPVVDRFVVTAPRSERAAEPERLVDVLNALGADDVEIVDGVPAAVDHAISGAGEEDLVLVFGSFYTASEARDWLRSKGALAQA
jgi:dihydrofolate synthase/folylpolyglutamate synthase